MGGVISGSNVTMLGGLQYVVSLVIVSGQRFHPGKRGFLRS